MTKLSVITPSLDQVQWLRLAIQSVADQEKTGFQVEHIVQDSCSTDGTASLLAQYPDVCSYIEKDTGMYHAVDLGMHRASGEIISYLNCDEQYLPGSLAKVVKFFKNNPQIDMLFAGLVVVDDTGNYICSRKVLPPLPGHTQVCHLSTFTCSTFFRRRVLDQDRLFFDPSWKAVGDAEWILRCLKKGLKMAAIPDLTSAFVDTGENLGTSTTSEIERDRLKSAAPLWMQYFTPLVALHHRLRRWMGGVYRQKPFQYSIYTRQDPAVRITFSVPKPTTVWKKRFTLLR